MPKVANFAALLAPDLPSLLTHQDLARACGVAPRTVRNWQRLGLLPPPLPVRGRKLWTAAQLRKHFASLEAAALSEGGAA